MYSRGNSKTQLSLRHSFSQLLGALTPAASCSGVVIDANENCQLQEPRLACSPAQLSAPAARNNFRVAIDEKYIVAKADRATHPDRRDHPASQAGLCGHVIKRVLARHLRPRQLHSSSSSSRSTAAAARRRATISTVSTTSSGVTRNRLRALLPDRSDAGTFTPILDKCQSSNITSSPAFRRSSNVRGRRKYPLSWSSVRAAEAPYCTDGRCSRLLVPGFDGPTGIETDRRGLQFRSRHWTGPLRVTFAQLIWRISDPDRTN
jgi:hypothetical protein